MRNIKRFLSFVLVFALLMTSLSCLGGVFSVAASADDVSFTGLDGVTVTTLGNRGALKTESQLTAAHGNNWIYAASEAFEFAPGTSPDYNFENNIVPTDGLVQPNDYVFLKVYYAIHGQYQGDDLYLGLASFAIFYSSDFFTTKTASASV
ncbi:MAG: hypothetical protein J5562_07275, partial [Clostridia bacterium]|nr:hypothetical protein [Clostridia bacterium]